MRFLLAPPLLVAVGCTGLARQGGAGLPFSARGEPVDGLQARARLLNGQAVGDVVYAGEGDPSALVIAYDLRSDGAAPVRVPGGLATDGEGTLILTAIAGPRSRTRAIALPASGGSDGPIELVSPPTDSPGAGWREYGSVTIDAEAVTGLELERGDLVSVVFVYDRGGDHAAAGEWRGRAYSGPVVMRVE